MGATAAAETKTETPPAEKPAGSSTEPPKTETPPADAGTKQNEQPAAEAKPASGTLLNKSAEQKTTDTGQDGGDTAAQGAPEKYELTLPEGGWLTDDDRTKFEAKARAAGLSNDDAQAALEEIALERKAEHDSFVEATTADPTYGGEKLEQTITLANKALDKLRPKGTPRGDALRGLLDRTGYGSHLEVLSLLADIGKAMADDTIPGAKTTDSKTTTTSKAEKFYGPEKK